MSFANYAPLATFWNTVKRAVGTQLITAADLYDNAILRVADNTAWLNAEITRRFAILASTTAGTPGKVTGSVDLTTLVYDPTAGDLNSKTFAVQSNNSGLITVTFGTGAGVAPTGPADVVAQINAATTSNPLASVDAAGHLSIASTTTGGTGTATVQSGSSVTLLGFTNGQTNTGGSTGGDGASAVGVPALTGTSFSTSASTLHTFLQGLVNSVASLSGTNLWTGANTFAGGLTLSGTLRALVASRSLTRMMRGDGTYDTNVGGVSGWTVTPVGTGATCYTQLVTGQVIQFPLDMPDGSTLTSINVRVQGAPGHAAFPGGAPTMPFFQLRKTTISGVTSTFGATTTDASATAGVYEAQHTLTQSSIGEVIDNATNRYGLEFTGEAGGNGLAGLIVYGLNVTCTVTSYPEW